MYFVLLRFTEEYRQVESSSKDWSQVGYDTRIFCFVLFVFVVVFLYCTDNIEWQLHKQCSWCWCFPYSFVSYYYFFFIIIFGSVTDFFYFLFFYFFIPIIRHFADFQKRIPREEMLQLQDISFKHIKAVDPTLVATVCGSFRRGAASSGDIDILLGHPEYISTGSGTSASPVKKKKQDLVKRVAELMEKEGFVTDTLSLGETKFMVYSK